ncbi:MAG: prepilin peptidase [Candidatus Margulisiibacteriota bacterium]
MEYLIMGVFGLLVGSFLNVCIYRLPRGGSVVFPPSSCVKCGRRLGPLELVPVLSWLLLRGKCAGCGVKISPRYPVVEGLTALLFCLCLWRFGLGIEFGFSIIFVCLLTAAAFIDLDTMELPDSVSLACAVLGLFYGLAVKNSLLFSVYGAAAGFLMMYAIYRIGSLIYRKEAMGGGDVKLSAAAGALLGWQGIVLAVYLAFFSALLFLIPALISGVKKRQDKVPFGPAIAAGACAALLFGSTIWNWYFGML